MPHDSIYVKRPGSSSMKTESRSVAAAGRARGAELLSDTTKMFWNWGVVTGARLSERVAVPRASCANETSVTLPFENAWTRNNSFKIVYIKILINEDTESIVGYEA